jgi:hypothetical protein
MKNVSPTAICPARIISTTAFLISLPTPHRQFFDTWFFLLSPTKVFFPLPLPPSPMNTPSSLEEARINEKLNRARTEIAELEELVWQIFLSLYEGMMVENSRSNLQVADDAGVRD